MEPTHVSFFAGVGGFDLGLERAGWRTIAYSEINPFAIAVFETHWPGILNLGDILSLRPAEHSTDGRSGGDAQRHDSLQPWTRATLWTGGFPCQDLSVAGKRAGLAGARSGLAFAFLALVERYRPPVVLLENVPGLLSSHRGRDLASLLGHLADMGYMGAYRILDARWFGLAQRRRRIFILAFDDDAFGGSGEQRAFEVLFEPEGGGGDTAAGGAARAGAAEGITRSLTGTQWKRHDDDTDTLIPFATLNSGGNDGGFRSEPGEHLVVAPTLGVGAQRAEDGGPGDTVPIALTPSPDSGGVRAPAGFPRRLDDPLLPRGLDSARYRVLGNAVAVPVAEWIGRRLVAISR